MDLYDHFFVTNMNILAQAASGGLGLTPLIWLLILPLMYFMVIRPNSKRQKEAQTFRDALKSGDRVITAGGLFGTIREVDDKSVVLEVASKVRIRVLRSQIVGSQGTASDNETGADAKDSDAA